MHLLIVLPELGNTISNLFGGGEAKKEEEMKEEKPEEKTGEKKEEKKTEEVRKSHLPCHTLPIISVNLLT
jgi:hypothetical protein